MNTGRFKDQRWMEIRRFEYHPGPYPPINREWRFPSSTSLRLGEAFRPALKSPDFSKAPVKISGPNQVL